MKIDCSLISANNSKDSNLQQSDIEWLCDQTNFTADNSDFLFDEIVQKWKNSFNSRIRYKNPKHFIEHYKCIQTNVGHILVSTI